MSDGKMVLSLFAAMAIAGAIVNGIRGGTHHSGGGGSSISSEDQSAVKSNCHDSVEGLLTSPATAHFHNETVNANNDGGYTLVGVVDSQNMYGALLSEAFTCDTTSYGTVLSDPIIYQS